MKTFLINTDTNIKPRKSYTILFFIMFIMPLLSFAQQQKQPVGLPEEIMAWTKSTLEPWPPDKYKSLREAIIDNKFFVTQVFRGSLITLPKDTFNRDTLTLNGKMPSPYTLNIKSVNNIFQHYCFRKNLDEMIYKNVLLKDPSNFKYSFLSKNKSESIAITRPTSIPKNTDTVKIVVAKPVSTPKTIDPTIKFIPDRKWWTSTFYTTINFTQNKTTDNWHKGIIDNVNLITDTRATYNFKRGKIIFDQWIKYNFSYGSAGKDTTRKYAVGNDQFQYHNTFGLKAIRNWNYTLNADFITPLANRYIINTDKKSTAFLSPYTITLGAGMAFKATPKFKNPNRTMDVSLEINPVTFKYFKSRDIPNHKFSRDYGTPDVRYIHTINFNKSISLYTNFYYWTNYERVTMDMENKLTVKISRYFAPVLHVFMRYDDGVKRKDPEDSYFQWNEHFSFGFTYTWW
jgi:hypothetical protein